MLHNRVFKIGYVQGLYLLILYKNYTTNCLDGGIHKLENNIVNWVEKLYMLQHGALKREWVPFSNEEEMFEALENGTIDCKKQ